MSLIKPIFSLLLILSSICVMGQDEGLFEKKQFNVSKHSLNYRILYPENFSESESYPVVLFLHGSGERGTDNEKQLVHGSAMFLNSENRKKFPAIVVFPQCPEDSYWSNAKVDRSTNPVGFDFDYKNAPTPALEGVMKLLDSLKQKAFVKKDQIYVAGLSMGGMGTFELLYRMPKTFAAAIAICGGGNPDSVSAYAKTTPIWIFHGAMDDVVDPKNSLVMTEALLKAGAHPKMSLYDTENHNSWDRAFAEPDFFPWLFDKKLVKETN